MKIEGWVPWERRFAVYGPCKHWPDGDTSKPPVIYDSHEQIVVDIRPRMKCDKVKREQALREAEAK